MSAEPVQLTAEDQTLLKELLRPGVKIDVIIPADATPQQLWATLETCCRGMNLLESRICRLKPIIGRILLIFEAKPSLYKDLGYDTYSDFMAQGVYGTLGLHRTSAYEGKLVARDWPQIDPDRLVRVKVNNVKILSKFTKGSSSNAELLLRAAERMSVSEFRQYVVQRGFVSAGETLPATILIHTNLDIYNHWKEMLEDGRVHSVVGSARADDILEAMMNECYGQWISQYEEKERAKANEIASGVDAGAGLAASS